MASRTAITTTFIDKLLAPLPDGIEQVRDKSFVRVLKKDAGHVWRQAMHGVTIAKARLDYERARRLADSSVNEAEVFDAYVVEVERQMRVPTILKEAIAWKRDHLPVGAFREQMLKRERLIARDVANMEGLSA